MFILCKTVKIFTNKICMLIFLFQNFKKPSKTNQISKVLNIKLLKFYAGFI